MGRTNIVTLIITFPVVSSRTVLGNYFGSTENSSAIWEKLLVPILGSEYALLVISSLVHVQLSILCNSGTFKFQHRIRVQRDMFSRSPALEEQYAVQLGARDGGWSALGAGRQV
jgi:hypothetical protein